MNAKMKKKGFTLVELLVVIAILAVLATVSIVGYTAFIKKANTSADQQAVTQMNNALQAADVTDNFDNIAEVQQFLLTCDLDIDGYKPLSKDTFFFWDKSQNLVVYTDKDYHVTYPEDYESDGEDDWFSLAGVIRTLSKSELKTLVEKESTGVYKATVSTPEQLFSISENYADYAGDELVITVSGELNMMGAALSFTSDSPDHVTIAAPDGSVAVIKNIANTEAASLGSKKNADGVARNDGGGLLAEIEAGDVVVLKNITLSGITTGDAKTGNVGAFVGAVYSRASLTLENCHVENSTIIGQKKVGGLIGFISQANGPVSVRITNCSVKNTEIQVYEGESGKVVGTVQMTEEQATAAGLNGVDVTGTTVVYKGNSKSTEVSYNYTSYGKTITYSMDTIDGVEFFAEKTDKAGEYRPFASDAKYFIQYRTNDALGSSYELLTKFVK